MRTELKFTLVILLLIGYFLYQFVILAIILNPEFYHNNTENILYSVGDGITAASYLLFVALIIAELKNLEEFHLDKFTILTFIIFSLLRRRFGIFGEPIFLVIIGLSGVLTAFALIIKKPVLPKTKIYWAMIGIITAGLSIIFITYIELLLRGAWDLSPLIGGSVPITAISQIINDISTSALLEELLFRSFLWGYLRRRGWAENKIFWIQNLLFWLMHPTRIFTPFSFFFSIPLLSFISSKLTYHSKQIFPAILSHTVFNAISAVLNLATF